MLKKNMIVDVMYFYKILYAFKKKSNFFGVAHDKRNSRWKVQRWSKHENKNVYYGYYDDEDTAAHASDTLARKLLDNDEQKLKLNFPDDQTIFYPKRYYLKCQKTHY